MSLQEPLAVPSTQRVFRPDPQSFAQREKHHRAIFTASNVPPFSVLVTVQGEIDAANGAALACYIERRLGGAQKLVIDLQTVEFFAASGFAALTHIDVICRRAGVRWSMLSGPQVDRLLKVCDPGRELPIDWSGVQHLRARPRDRKFLVGRNH